MTEDPIDKAKRETSEEDPSGRLSAYTARTQTGLDLLALATLWIVVVPPGDFSTAHDVRTIAFIVRISVSVVYGIDMAIRASLARRHLHYVTKHPVGVLSVFLPPVRVIFSLRLVRSVFRRGHLERFLLAAAVLVTEGAIIVYLFERHAPGSNIHTLGDSIWWSVVTVTTVGYGDFYPVTAQGRITAVFIMFIGLLALAVVTAQVAAVYLDQASRRQQRPSASPPAISSGSMVDLDRRLARIEDLLTATATSLRSAAGGSKPDVESEPS
jgi:voltage-gated potassium channel